MSEQPVCAPPADGEQPPCGPPPSPEHKQLQEAVGTWDIECSFFGDPSGEPMKVPATETVEALGPFWVVSRFKAPFVQGQASLGYNPVTKKYISQWIDTGNPWAHSFEGERDPATGVLRLEGTNHDPMTGILTKFRSEESADGPDKRLFKMWYTAPGYPETQLLEYRYTRRRG